MIKRNVYIFNLKRFKENENSCLILERETGFSREIRVMNLFLLFIIDTDNPISENRCEIPKVFVLRNVTLHNAM